jgi:CRISPR/Cas system endoribonuclease Cas6 (RAMP superfamily)
MMTLRNMREQVPKPLHVSVRKVGAHFRVVYQRQYSNAMEDVVYSERFKTPEEAQKFVDAALRAQRIYRNLSPRSDAVPL